MRDGADGDGGCRMKVLYLFGPNLGALGTARSRDLRIADARRDHGRGRRAGARRAATRSRGISPITRASWSGGCSARARRSASSVVHQPRRALALLLRPARRDRGLRSCPSSRCTCPTSTPARSSGIHRSSPRSAGRTISRPRGRWLSSGAGGDAVDHRVRRDALSARLEDLAVDALLITRLPHTSATSRGSPGPTDRCSCGATAPCSSPTGATRSSPAGRSPTSSA